MLITAKQSYTRQTPRKVRLVANAVKDLSLEKAMSQLAIIERRSTEVVAKVIRQAVANAVHNHGYQVSDLAIESILVNEGPRYRRFQAVSRGRAHGIIKRTCHVTVTLRTSDEPVKGAKAASKAETKVDAKAEAAVEAKTEVKVEKKETKKETKKAKK